MSDEIKANDEEAIEKTAIEDKKEEPVKTPEKKSPIKLITRIVLIVSALFFVWYVMSERHTPYTDQARIKGLITPVSPRVAGYVTNINIYLHKKVKAGDTLFQLDRLPFEIAITKAEANIDNTMQSVAASSASVKSAAGKLGVAKAQLERAERNWARVQKVMKENSGALSEADVDQSETALLQATEQVASSEANLERAKQSLGDSGPDNPKIRAAIQDLENAKLNLEFTTVIAPTDGVIESFDIDLGYYAAAGAPMTTLISDTDIWIQADMKENSLSKMKEGNKVKITFDIAPGKIVTGTVRSIGYGVSTSDQTNKGGLPKITSKNSWLRDPQRFPVIISIDGDELEVYRLGGQADIVVYTGDNFILNSLASFRIKLNSWLSYVR